MPTPSLILVPARFKTGKLYTPLATTSGGVVLGASGDFNVTRATTATRVNASGFIEVVASGIPRLDYPLGGGCPALLVEPSGTNFARGVGLLNTPSPVTASGGITVTTGSTDFLAPDGTSGTITKYVGGTASGSNFLEYVSSTSVTAAGVHTFSAFVKAGTTNPLNFCALQFTAFTGGSGTGTSYFSLASGTALTTGASIQNYGNGWYRIISAPYTIAAGDLTGDIRLLFAEGNNDASFPASGALNLTLYAWGIQLEAGSVATSYIPTTTTSATRNAEVISVTGSVSGCIGQTQGTMYAEFRYLGRETTRAGILYLRQTASRGLGISLASNDISFLSRNTAGTTVITLVNGLTFGTYYKIAVAYDTGGTAAGGTQVSGVTAYVNGSPAYVSVGDLRVPDATISEIRLYGAVSGSDNETANANIRSAALYTTRLTNAELAALTT